MDNNCNIDDLEIRKYPRGELPLDSCRECLFNVLCNDYIIYEESNGDLDRDQKDSWKN